jgi:hypothetical protein
MASLSWTSDTSTIRAAPRAISPWIHRQNGTNR